MNSIELNRGECLRVQAAWTDEGGPVDLTGRTLEITEAYPRALQGGTATVTDAEAGEFEIFIPESLMAAAGSGRVNWIRIAMSLPGACKDATPRIWISIT